MRGVSYKHRLLTFFILYYLSKMPYNLTQKPACYPYKMVIFIIPPANFVWGYTVFTSVRVCVRACVRPSVRPSDIPPPPPNFVCVEVYCFTLSVRVCVRPSVRRPSETLCFLNILKSHCWIFIRPCKHVHICKTNTLDKKVRTRGQFYKSYFPL